MAATPWTIRGEYMESCNCDYLCPCIYTNPQGNATHEHCYGERQQSLLAPGRDGLVHDARREVQRQAAVHGIQVFGHSPDDTVLG